VDPIKLYDTGELVEVVLWNLGVNDIKKSIGIVLKAQRCYKSENDSYMLYHVSTSDGKIIECFDFELRPVRNHKEGEES